MGAIIQRTQIAVPTGDIDIEINKSWIWMEDGIEMTLRKTLPNTAHNYVCNLYGLLHRLEIPEELWYITMTYNGISDMSRYDGRPELWIPVDDGLFAKIRLMRSLQTKDLIEGSL